MLACDEQYSCTFDRRVDLEHAVSAQFWTTLELQWSEVGPHGTVMRRRSARHIASLLRQHIQAGLRLNALYLQGNRINGWPAWLPQVSICSMTGTPHTYPVSSLFRRGVLYPTDDLSIIASDGTYECGHPSGPDRVRIWPRVHRGDIRDIRAKVSVK